MLFMRTMALPHRCCLQFFPGTMCLAIAILSSTAGCGRSSSATPDQLILYSIDGRVDPYLSTAGEQFRGYPVLGKLDIKEAADRQEIMAALAEGIANSDGTMAKCFWPRHALHAVTKGRSVDYVICFECLQLQIDQGAGPTLTATTREPQTVVNSFLTDAHIPIAPGLHE
jgi:hypothetical protein